jgi:acetyltransferase-like isoleucine patch superfamily enzyme
MLVQLVVPVRRLSADMIGPVQADHDAYDEFRARYGYLPIAGIDALVRTGTVIAFEPYTLLISVHATLGRANVFYPGVRVDCDGISGTTIGDGNVFHTGTTIRATDGGVVAIGSANLLGDGGTRLSATHSRAVIAIGDRTRVAGGADLAGRVTVGHGAQILGAIGVQDVTLGAGEDFRHADPDRRGGVLKGHGPARGLTVHAGEVIAAYGRFEQAGIERQRAYHP